MRPGDEVLLFSSGNGNSCKTVKIQTFQVPRQEPKVTDFTPKAIQISSVGLHCGFFYLQNKEAFQEKINI